MNALIIIICALVVAVVGYRWYAGFIDRKVMEADANRMTPAKMYMDGVDFMPTPKNVLFGYQFKSIAGAGPVVGAIIALQWGWLPAILWLFLGVIFIGWVHDYVSGMVSMRCDGLSLGGLSHKLISPRSRLILLSFVYFYLLLLAGAFGGVVAGALTKLGSGPLSLIILGLAGFLAGQMIYKWRVNILVMTVVCVALALVGIELGKSFPAEWFLGANLAQSKLLWGYFCRGFFFPERGAAHLAVCPALKLCGLLHCDVRPGGWHCRDFCGKSSYTSPGLYPVYHWHRPPLAHPLCHHSLRGLLGLAFHGDHLGNLPAVGERD